MSVGIVIVDYGTCSCKSIKNMVHKLGYKAEIVERPEYIEKADKIILPGVGAFDQGMKNLSSRGLNESLHNSVTRRSVPTLGICLGAQLMTNESEEGSESGLGWIDAETIKFTQDREDSPNVLTHVGWAETQVKDIPLFTGLQESHRYYFVHSYHFQLHDQGLEICTARHGYKFTAGFMRENLIGVQFHPEKSRRFGMNLLANFLERY